MQDGNGTAGTDGPREQHRLQARHLRGGVCGPSKCELHHQCAIERRIQDAGDRTDGELHDERQRHGGGRDPWHGMEPEQPACRGVQGVVPQGVWPGERRQLRAVRCQHRRVHTILPCENRAQQQRRNLRRVQGSLHGQKRRRYDAAKHRGQRGHYRSKRRGNNRRCGGGPASNDIRQRDDGHHVQRGVRHRLHHDGGRQGHGGDHRSLL